MSYFKEICIKKEDFDLHGVNDVIECITNIKSHHLISYISFKTAESKVEF